MIPEGLDEDLRDIQAFASALVARSELDPTRSSSEPFILTRADVHALASSMQLLTTMALGMAEGGKALANHPLMRALGIG